MQVEYISMQDRFKLMLPCASRNQSITFLEALNAAHHPLALYPPQQIRTDSFSQAFFDYLRAIDRLLSMPSLLQQRSDLQAQLPRGAFSDCPIRRSSQVCHKMATSIVLLAMLATSPADMPVPYPGGAAHHSVHELGLQRDRMGQSDKDTRAASNAIKAKLRTARQLLKEAALYQALGSGDAAAVSMVRGEPAPWAEASTATPYGKLLHYERQLHHLQSDRDRCVEQQAMLRIEHSRLLVWLQHMIVVCKGACSEPEAHGEAEYLVPLVTPL
ncbi:hypothetical protein QJQ45_010979 [Haematococcus lacustris]|nr:hypothetical protein QJQ45_010979 [Haematococcus lacustris]